MEENVKLLTLNKMNSAKKRTEALNNAPARFSFVYAVIRGSPNRQTDFEGKFSADDR